MVDIREINQSQAKICFLLDSESTKLWSHAQWKFELNKKDVKAIAIYVQEKFVGVCVFQFIFDEAELLYLAIFSEYAKRGYGRMLFAKFLEISKKNNIKRIFLEVSSENKPAIHFYESFKFTTFGIRKKYYKDGSDALLKEKNVK